MTYKQLAVLGVVLIALCPYLSFVKFPTQEAMRAHAVVAKHVYAEGGFIDIMVLRAREALHFILPLLLGSMVRTFALMLLGVATWRSGFLRRPRERRKALWIVLVAAGGLGAAVTTFEIGSSEIGTAASGAFDWLYPHAAVLLAFGYGAGMLLWMGSEGALPGLFAPVGRMALTNYLGQSFIFSFLFYGFGFGWFGKLGPAVTALIGLLVFAVQVFASERWLRHFRFGPAEWFWRSVAYRQWQPFRA